MNPGFTRVGCFKAEFKEDPGAQMLLEFAIKVLYPQNALGNKSLAGVGTYTKIFRPPQL